MATKWRRARGELSLSSEGKENYENDTGDETYLNPANNKYLVQL